MREARRDDRFALSLGFEDGLEIVLLGDCDLSGDYTERELIVVNAEGIEKNQRTVRSPRDCPC